MSHSEPQPTSFSPNSARLILLVAVGLPLALLVVVTIAAYVVFLTPWVGRLLLGGTILLVGLLAIGVTTARLLRQFLNQTPGYAPAGLVETKPAVTSQTAAPPRPDSRLGQVSVNRPPLAPSPQTPAEVDLEALRTEFNRFSPTPFEVIAVHEKIKLLHMSTTLASLFNYEPGEIAGLTLLDLTPPEVHGALLQRILSKYDHPYEILGRRKGGDTFRLEILSLTLFHQGQTLRVMGLREITGEKPEEVVPSSSKTIAELEGEVKRNTSELRYANERLQLELNARKQAEDALRESNRELTILQSASMAITSRLDLRYVLDTFSLEMTKLPSVESCAIFEWKPTEDIVVKVAEYRPEGWWDSNSQPEIHLLSDYPLLKSVLEEQVPEQMTLNQPYADPAEIVRMKEAQVKSRLFLPMVFQTHVLGLVRLEHGQVEHVFSNQEISLAKLLANQAASAIKNARLFEQAQAEIKERQRAEAALEQERAHLAERVKERTAELSRANAELARASRHKDEFLASMSHELRTPLNAILGSAEILQSQVFGPLQEKQTKYVKNVDESGRHLLSLINDILDLSKIEAGKMELTIRPVSIQAVCEASVRLVKELAHKKQLKLQQRLNTTVTTVTADERRLKQILVNLLSNAVKFTPEGGLVGLEVNEEIDRQVINFTVWDSGIGIAEKDMARLFQPFVQLDSALSRQYAGTGLGLSLVSRMVEMLGGGITVASEAGHGSCFTVSFPYSSPAEMAESPQETSPIVEAPGPGTPSPHEPLAVLPLVLLVEDNEVSISMFTDYLQYQKFRVVIARNGYEALERSHEEKPDIILMDSQMPEMDGLEATRRIRADTQLASIPIIMMTAMAMPGDRERCLTAGANEYLSKPINLQEMVKIIKAYLT